jgi:hypothetical protein
MSVRVRNSSIPTRRPTKPTAAAGEVLPPPASASASNAKRRKERSKTGISRRVGVLVGARVGESDGACDGLCVCGASVGAYVCPTSVGALVGVCIVGDAEGEDVLVPFGDADVVLFAEVESKRRRRP